MPIPNAPILFPPNGLDRGDGTIAGGVGTATPAGSLAIFGVDISGKSFVAQFPEDANFFEEFPDSPTIERAEQATITHRFICDKLTGEALIDTYARGYIFLDSNGNLTRLLSNTGQYVKGGHLLITMVSEGLSFDPPPDLFGIEVVELNPDIDKHPRYNQLSYHQKFIAKEAGQRYANLDLDKSFDQMIRGFNGAPVDIGPPANANLRTAYNEARELLLKTRRGETSFYMPGFRVQWSTYYWAPVAINPGVYLEDPIISGGLPFFFWSLDGSEDPGEDNTLIPLDFPAENGGLWSNSWFAELASHNPAVFGDGLSWLRLSDSVEYERTWFKVTKTWLGGSLGHFDNEFYNRIVQPYQTEDDANAISIPTP